MPIGDQSGLVDAPELLAFVPCMDAAELSPPFTYSIEGAFVQYPVSQIPCNARGFLVLLEFSGGRGKARLTLRLHAPDGVGVVTEEEKPVTFKGPMELKSLAIPVRPFTVQQDGRHRLELLVDGRAIAVRPITVFVNPSLREF